MGRKKEGFTLIELLVVISIIGLLASIVLVSLNSARGKARNAKRLSDIKQYAIAFELALDENNEYPDYGGTGWVCLGDYSDNRCWYNGTSILENATLNTLLANYIPGLPATEVIVGGLNGYEGALYRCELRTNGICSPIDIRWFMEGANQSCGGEITLNNNYGGRGITYCQLKRTI